MPRGIVLLHFSHIPARRETSLRRFVYLHTRSTRRTHLSTSCKFWRQIFGTEPLCLFIIRARSRIVRGNKNNAMTPPRTPHFYWQIPGPRTPHFYWQIPGPRQSGQMPAQRGVGFASCSYVVWASLLRGKPIPSRAGICPFYHIVHNYHPQQEDRGLL